MLPQSPEKIETSHGSNIFTCNLPHYTASMRSFPHCPYIFLMPNHLISMHPNFPQARFMELLVLPQNGHKFKIHSSNSQPSSHDFFRILYCHNLMFHINIPVKVYFRYLPSVFLCLVNNKWVLFLLIIFLAKQQKRKESIYHC